MIFFGYYHIAHPKAMMEYGYIPNDSSVVWVQVVGVAFILAAISFIINKFVKITAYLLAIMLLAFAFFIHFDIYKHASADDVKVNALINILKDTALAAFALHIAGSADSHGIKF